MNVQKKYQDFISLNFNQKLANKFYKLSLIVIQLGLTYLS